MMWCRLHLAALTGVLFLAMGAPAAHGAVKGCPPFPAGPEPAKTHQELIDGAMRVDGGWATFSFLLEKHLIPNIDSLIESGGDIERENLRIPHAKLPAYKRQMQKLVELAACLSQAGDAPRVLDTIETARIARRCPAVPDTPYAAWPNEKLIAQVTEKMAGDWDRYIRLTRENFIPYLETLHTSGKGYASATSGQRYRNDQLPAYLAQLRAYAQTAACLKAGVGAVLAGRRIGIDATPCLTIDRRTSVSANRLTNACAARINLRYCYDSPGKSVFGRCDSALPGELRIAGGATIEIEKAGGAPLRHWSCFDPARPYAPDPRRGGTCR